MIKCIEFPDRTFASKAEMFKALKDNEQKLIGIKKAQVYKSAEKGQLSFLTMERAQGAIKGGFEAENDYIYPIISTTKYLDSHNDVHFDGCFGKTVKEQQGKVYYALDHELKFDSILAWQKDVSMFVADIPWGYVGKSYEGLTQALVFKIHKDNIRNKAVLEAIENKAADFENSIRMVYYKISLGINDASDDFAENKAYYDSKINEIANKEAVEAAGFFWGVEELGIHKEGSLVVAGGSNDATAIYTHENKQQPDQSTTEQNEPDYSTHTEQLKELLKKFNSN